jgi:hypothetical protein
MKKFAAVLLLLSFFTISSAQPPTPEEKIYYAPFPVAIALDGKFDDWENVPTVTLSELPKPSTVEGENGPVSFALAADETNLYIYADVTDKTVLAGTKGTDYWQEDSIEFYINATGDLSLQHYESGVSQMTITPLNIGRDLDETLVSGIQGKDAGAKAFVIQTEKGYALELAVPLKNEVWNITPQHGTTIGFEFKRLSSTGFTAQQTQDTRAITRAFLVTSFFMKSVKPKNHRSNLWLKVLSRKSPYSRATPTAQAFLKR